MPHKDWMPQTDNDLLTFHDGFTAGIAGNAAALGISPADVTTLQADNKALHQAIPAAAQAQAAASAAVQTKNATVDQAQQNVRRLAKLAKLSANYGPAIATTLQIEGPKSALQAATAHPTISATAQPGGVVVIKFPKGDSDGVNIYCQRDGDAAPVFVARDTCSPYIDNRLLLVAGKPKCAVIIAATSRKIRRSASPARMSP